MSGFLTTSAQVSAAVRELDGLADSLGMPDQERCGILGLNRHAYRSWRGGFVESATAIAPELVRRLDYALPLMRRMAAHTPKHAVGRDRDPSRPVGN